MTNPVSPVVRRWPGQYAEGWATDRADNYQPLGVFAEATGTLALTADTLYATPVFVDRPIRVSTAAVVVTTAGAASTTVRLGIFEWDREDRAAGALVSDLGVFDVDATGLATISLTTPLDLDAGWYAVAVIADASVTLRTVQANDRMAGSVFTVSTTTVLAPTHYSAASQGTAHDAMPETAPALTAVTSATDFRTNQVVLFRFTTL